MGEKTKVITKSYQEERINSVFSNITVTFDNLYATWKQETSFVSSTKIFKDINYQKIVALGESVLPTLIQKLNGSSTFLFPALHQITGIDPIQPEHVGNTALMTEDWRHWWEENRHHYA
ncbi:hypothetical protein FACS1894109_18060 [Spirochaetia bacterium]|nr:hypothetical protein FACS1894109_18060 [Spirochaetia bacterium]